MHVFGSPVNDIIANLTYQLTAYHHIQSYSSQRQTNWPQFVVN